MSRANPRPLRREGLAGRRLQRSSGPWRRAELNLPNSIHPTLRPFDTRSGVEHRRMWNRTSEPQTNADQCLQNPYHVNCRMRASLSRLPARFLLGLRRVPEFNDYAFGIDANKLSKVASDARDKLVQLPRPRLPAKLVHLKFITPSGRRLQTRRLGIRPFCPNCTSSGTKTGTPGSIVGSSLRA